MESLSIIFAVFIFLFGLFSLLFPQITWKFQHMLHVKGGEPTVFSLIMTRIAGILLIVLSILMFTGFLH